MGSQGKNAEVVCHSLLQAQMVKESACNAGDLGSIPGLGRSPGEGHGNPLQYSCLENPHGQRSLVGYSPWGHKELDMTEWLSTCPRWREKVNSTKTTKWNGYRQTSRKRIRNIDSEDDPGSWENNGEDAKIVYQRLGITKEQINRWILY